VLFGVDPTAAGPFAAVGAVLLASGMIAAVTAALPIRRIDPIEVLRAD
jgi:hypothetical protein